MSVLPATATPSGDPNPHNATVIRQFTQWAAPFADLPIHAEAESMAQTMKACAPGPAVKALDVACGPGIVSCALAEAGAEVTGLDLTPAMIAQASARADRLGVKASFQTGNAMALPFEDAQFDLVVTRYSFHHMETPQACLTEMIRVCRPGGRIVVIDATPAPACQSQYDHAEKLRDPSHTTALTLSQIMALGDEAGLRHVETSRYRLESRLNDQVAEEDREALASFLMQEIASGENRSDMAPRQTEGGIVFSFPISIVVWNRPRA